MTTLHECAIRFARGCHWMLLGLRTAKDMHSRHSCIAGTTMQSSCIAVTTMQCWYH